MGMRSAAHPGEGFTARQRAVRPHGPKILPERAAFTADSRTPPCAKLLPMPDQRRRRIDLTCLPAAARYAVALAVLVIVTAMVFTTRGDETSTQPASWYTAVVSIGAVALLLYGVIWLVLRVATFRRRRR